MPPNQMIANNKSTMRSGYMVAINGAIALLLAWGTYFTYGIFFEPLLAEFGWSRAIASGVFSLSTLVSGALGVIAGRLSDRLGPRVVCITCGLCFGAGYILMSRVNATWQVYLLFGLPLAAGIGGIYPAVVSTVAKWFIEKRGLMTGLVTAGMGVGTLIFPPLVSHFILAYGWRIAYVIIGALSLLAIVITSYFLKRNPQENSSLPLDRKPVENTSILKEQGFTFRQAILTRQYWLVALIYALSGYYVLSILVHIVPYASGLGISEISSAGILSVASVANIAGRIIMGSVSDRIRAKSCLILLNIIFLLSFSWLEFAGNLWTLYLFGIFFGFGWGGLSSMQTITTGELFGLNSLGLLVGIFAFGFCIGGALGPIFSGYLFDISGNYMLAFLFCAILSLVGVFCAILLTPTRINRNHPSN